MSIYAPEPEHPDYYYDEDEPLKEVDYADVLRESEIFKQRDDFMTGRFR